MEFKPWQKWTLIGLGVTVLIVGTLWWLRKRARAESIEDSDSADAVALFTPGLGPDTVAGLSEYPDEIPIAAGQDLFSLLDYERAQEVEDRGFAEEDKITKTLRQLWDEVNKTNIRTGQALTKVCITSAGAVGVGDQCKRSKNPQRVYGGE